MEIDHSNKREMALRSLKSGRTLILVATVVAARGLDIPHVAHVINFDVPIDMDDYFHRICRTGWAGKTGLATAFFHENNSSLARPLSELMQESNQEVPPWLMHYASRSYGGCKSHRSGGGNRFAGQDFRSERSFNRTTGYYGGGYNNAAYGNSPGYAAYSAGVASARD